MPIDLELNFALGNQIYFYQKKKVLRKATKLETWKSGLKLKKTFVIERHQVGMWWDQNLCIFKTSGFVDLAQAGLDFHSDPLTFDLTQIFNKKCSKSAKSSPIFHLKGRRDTSWFYNFWIAQWVNFFLQNYFFKNLAIFFRGKKGVKVGPKVQTLGISRFCKNLSFSKILKALFLFPWILPVVKILAESGNIWGS